MSKYILIFLLPLITIANNSASCQYFAEGLNLDDGLTTWYDNTIGKSNLKIFEGKYVKLESPNLDQNQFFVSGHWDQGQMVFENHAYENIDLLYNSLKDLVIVRNEALHISIDQPTLINQDLIQEFEIHQRKFVNLDDKRCPPYGPGFYQQLFVGQAFVLYAKRIKNEYIKSGRLVYEEEDKYYIHFQKSYYKYAGRTTLFKLLPDHKSDLKGYASNLNLNLRRDGEKDLIELVKHADRLITLL